MSERGHRQGRASGRVEREGAKRQVLYTDRRGMVAALVLATGALLFILDDDAERGEASRGERLMCFCQGRAWGRSAEPRMRRGRREAAVGRL